MENILREHPILKEMEGYINNLEKEISQMSAGSLQQFAAARLCGALCNEWWSIWRFLYEEMLYQPGNKVGEHSDAGFQAAH